MKKTINGLKQISLVLFIAIGFTGVESITAMAQLIGQAGSYKKPEKSSKKKGGKKKKKLRPRPPRWSSRKFDSVPIRTITILNLKSNTRSNFWKKVPKLKPMYSSRVVPSSLKTGANSSC